MPRDPQAVADALSRLVADPELRRRHGEHGRTRASAFTWERAVEGVLDQYRALGLEF